MHALNKTSLKTNKPKDFFWSFGFVAGCWESSWLGLVHSSEVFPIRGHPTEHPAPRGQAPGHTLGPAPAPRASWHSHLCLWDGVQLGVRVTLFQVIFLFILIKLSFNLCWVDVRIESSHDGKYYADDQKQCRKQDVLGPLWRVWVGAGKTQKQYRLRECMYTLRVVFLSTSRSKVLEMQLLGKIGRLWPQTQNGQLFLNAQV